MDGMEMFYFPEFSNQWISSLSIKEQIEPPDMTEKTEVECLQNMRSGTRIQGFLIQQLPPQLHKLLQNFHLPANNGHLLLQSLKEGMLVGASDGSSKKLNNEQVGGYSFSLQDWHTDQGRIVGCSSDHMSNDSMSLTTELLGICATVLSLTEKS